jgi:hypothetical protein
MKAIEPAPTTLRASIVVVNQTGTSASGKNISPRMPVTRKTTRNPTNQRTAWPTSRKTRAPSGARMPHSPTPPEGRNPPAVICPAVVVRRTSSSWTMSSGRKLLVRANTTSDATETAKYTNGMIPTGEPKAR